MYERIHIQVAFKWNKYLAYAVCFFAEACDSAVEASVNKSEEGGLTTYERYDEWNVTEEVQYANRNCIANFHRNTHAADAVITVTVHHAHMNITSKKKVLVKNGSLLLKVTTAELLAEATKEVFEAIASTEEDKEVTKQWVEQFRPAAYFHEGVQRFLDGKIGVVNGFKIFYTVDSKAVSADNVSIQKHYPDAVKQQVETFSEKRVDNPLPPQDKEVAARIIPMLKEDLDRCKKVEEELNLSAEQWAGLMEERSFRQAILDDKVRLNYAIISI